MPRLRVNGYDLELVDEGVGVPVVFSHGGSSDLRYWEPQRLAFSRRYRFVSYTHRFHGTGPWPGRSDYSADAHTADLVALISSLDAGPVHLVGFSSAVALRAAVRESALLRSLTIIEPNVPWLLEGPDGDEATLSWWRAENERVTAEAAGNSERRAVLWFELVNNRGPHAFDEQPDALRRMWLDNFNAVRPPTPPPSPLRCEDLRAITAPTLVLCAQFGMPYSRRIAQRVAECISSSRLVLVPSVTHFMTYQAPGQFNGTLLAFLDDH